MLMLLFEIELDFYLCPNKTSTKEHLLVDLKCKENVLFLIEAQHLEAIDLMETELEVILQEWIEIQIQE